MTTRQAPKRKGPGLVSVEDGLGRLRMKSKIIRQRKGLVPRDENRLYKDITLYRNGDQAEGERQRMYLNFLEQFHSHPSMLVLCIIGLGLSVIAKTRDNILVELADAIIQQIHNFDSPVLHELATKYLQPGSSPGRSNTATQAATNGVQSTTQRGRRATEG